MRNRKEVMDCVELEGCDGWNEVKGVEEQEGSIGKKWSW